ncbi:hypothetical protein JW926_07030 [Candidatus Sumerlaeota bacterium]|nr:hypothetical protein [Candidatus Sumerlaeota bacterium]
MAVISKDSRKQLKELAQVAYERELAHHLNELAEKFEKWKNKEITSSELNELIHNFYNGTSKRLYSIYHYLDSDGIVARALAFGFLSDDEVPKELKSQIRSMINFYKEHDMD